MAITANEFEYRSSQLHFLPYQESSRLIGFVKWLEEDEGAAKVLSHLRGLERLGPLINGRKEDEPPQPESPEEVAAIGLCVIDTCREKKTNLGRVAVSLGIFSRENNIQTYSDMVLNRYVLPFISYLERELFGMMPASVIDIPPDWTNLSDVFIVHGRDNEAKETTARFVSQLGLNPIVLHERPNKGRTIIEKFEDHAEVQFAIILLTPDEVGRLVADPAMELEMQARQNVIFEMGFFIGRIGRARVFALKKGRVQAPSDYDGVVYTDMDPAGAWKLALVRELKAAGFDVDANKAF